MNYINSFPLYDNLIKEVDNTTIRINKPKLAKILQSAEGIDRDSIYLIIKSYNLKNGKVSNPFDLPYKGNVISIYDNNLQDIEFNLINMPTDLIKLLYIFCEKYLK